MMLSAKFVAITVILLATCGVALAETESLPRGTAPIFLGMGKVDFEKITGAKSEACLECVTHEDRYVLLKTKGIFEDTSIPEGADASFFSGRLYRLGIGFEERLEKALPQFRVKYGPEKRHIDWNNGISAYIWEDGQTVLEIHHGTNKSQAFALFFEDKLLRRQLQDQYEKDKKAGIKRD